MHLTCSLLECFVVAYTDAKQNGMQCQRSVHVVLCLSANTITRVVCKVLCKRWLGSDDFRLPVYEFVVRTSVARELKLFISKCTPKLEMLVNIYM